jgi:hypothetical protein
MIGKFEKISCILIHQTLTIPVLPKEIHISICAYQSNKENYGGTASGKSFTL